MVAGDNLEINGRPFHEAFNSRQGHLILKLEYEPIDEKVRSRADELQTEVQLRLVQLAEIRKKLPIQLDSLNSATIKKITNDSESGIIPKR